MSACLRPHADNLALLQAHCAALAGAASASASQRTPAFQAALAWHCADLEDDIFPALFTSMAGSDAVCIREMRERVSAQLDALALQWWRLQALLAATAAPPAHLPAEGEALCALCHAIVDFETRELLPMAERLLDDATLAHLRAAMVARRAARS